MKTCTYFAAMALVLVFSSPSSALGQTNWSTAGNGNTDPNCFIGTTDQQSLTLKTNGQAQLQIKANGLVKLQSLTGQGRSAVVVDPNGVLQRVVDPGPNGDCAEVLWDGNGNSVGIGCFIGTNNSYPFRIKTAAQERMRIDENGNVGIQALTVQAPLQVFNYYPITFDQVNGSGGYIARSIGFNSYFDGATPKYSSTGPASSLEFDAVLGLLQVNMSLPGQAGSVRQSQTALSIDQSGQVGLGIQFPFSQLHVYNTQAETALRIQSGQLSGSSRLEFWTGEAGSPSEWRPGYICSGLASNYTGELHFMVNGSGSNASTGSVQAFKTSYAQTQFNTRVGIGMPPQTGNRLSLNGNLSLQSGQNQLEIGHNASQAYINLNAPGNSRLQINGSGQPSSFGGDVYLDGHLLIGTDSIFDQGREFHLSINGDLRAKAARVYPTWADHVFAPGYALMPLASVKDYIAIHGHLPGIPSAAEVAAQGIDVGESQAALLAKIEELTLHLIRLEQEVKQLKENSTAKSGQE